MHAAVDNTFNLQRKLVSRTTLRLFQDGAGSSPAARDRRGKTARVDNPNRLPAPICASAGQELRCSKSLPRPALRCCEPPAEALGYGVCGFDDQLRQDRQSRVAHPLRRAGDAD
jgi:hypothetical protein